MALWQVGFFVLPKDSIEFINSFRVSKEHTFDDAPYWKAKKMSPLFFNEINSFLPQTKSWADYLTIYGNEISNRLEVVSENNIVESVSFRIDFTSNYEMILRKIIDFCLLKKLIILDEELNNIQLDFEIVNSTIKNAPQLKKYNDFLGLK